MLMLNPRIDVTPILRRSVLCCVDGCFRTFARYSTLQDIRQLSMEQYAC